MIFVADTVRQTADLDPYRLFGIDAPELRGPERPAGLAARDFLRDLIEPGKWFTIETIKDTKGKYGRYLCKIVLDDGTNINELLVESGHAIAREY